MFSRNNSYYPALTARLFTLSLFLSIAATGQGLKPDYQLARELVTKFMSANQVPGAAVAVSINGKTIWAEGFGVADKEQNTPVDPARTRFRIASISKPLTATGLAILIQKGKIHPDSSIQHYLPWFPNKKYRPTVRQVSGHLGGIRHYRGNENFSSVHYASVRDGLKIFEQDSLINKPGTEYVYSSYGFNLISAVMESASGEPFLKWMQREVLDPLELKWTTADRLDSIISFRGRYYERSGRNSPMVDNSYKWAGGGYLSTATDLLRFGNSYLSNKLLHKETMDLLTAPQTLSNGKSTGYGMGWGSGTDNHGRNYFGHSGGAVGGTCHIAIYPKEKMVVTLLTNVSGAQLGNITADVADSVFHAQANNKN